MSDEASLQEDFPARVSAFNAWAGFERSAVWAKPVEREGLCVIAARKGKKTALIEALQARYNIIAPDHLGCAGNDEATLIATAPGIWLMTRANAERTLAAELRGHIGGLASIADQSGAYARLRLGGPGAAALLQKGVFIDLASFPAAAAATTHVAHLGLVLWRNTADPIFELALFRSTALDFVHWLEYASTAGQINS